MNYRLPFSFFAHAGTWPSGARLQLLRDEECSCSVRVRRRARWPPALFTVAAFNFQGV